ncbi:MAG: SurA N-terminal domain-containing protein, partial [Muribaculaceae bacterium]|nr:SurA N-terminal domain-containing protein [Muribaculaceae bacterium]
QMRQAGRDDGDVSYADEMALQQIVDEELFNNELEALGITVTDEEMQDYLFGPGSIASMEAQRYGFPSAEDFYSYAYSNESGSDTARALWDDMENRIRRQLMSAKFQLQLGAITANKLDAKAYYDENKNVTLNVAKVDYASLPNEGFDVTDAEIKDLYNKEKEAYRLDNEVRLVDYILVTPTPSAQDASTASDEVVNAVSRLKATPGTEAIAGNYAFETSVHTGSAASLPASLRNAIDRIAADTVVMLSFNGSAYNLAKLLGAKTGIEKADVDFYLTDNGTLPIDSIIAAVNAGDVAQYGDSVQKVSQKELKLIDNALLAGYADSFINAPQGANVVTDNGFKSDILSALFGSQVDPSRMDMDAIGVCYKVNSVDEPQTIYEVASITRKLVPSEETISALRKELSDYSVKNANAKAFAENIGSSSFHIEKGRVYPDRFAVIGQNGQRIPQTV